jgi:hypothetical protein
VILQELAWAGFHTAMFITDAQIHLWEINRPDRPLMEGLQCPPHRPNGFSAEEIIAGNVRGSAELALSVETCYLREKKELHGVTGRGHHHSFTSENEA